jgi:hypothetical protein
MHLLKCYQKPLLTHFDGFDFGISLNLNLIQPWKHLFINGKDQGVINVKYNIEFAIWLHFSYLAWSQGTRVFELLHFLEKIRVVYKIEFLD